MGPINTAEKAEIPIKYINRSTNLTKQILSYLFFGMMSFSFGSSPFFQCSNVRDNFSDSIQNQGLREVAWYF